MSYMAKQGLTAKQAAKPTGTPWPSAPPHFHEDATRRPALQAGEIEQRTAFGFSGALPVPRGAAGPYEETCLEDLDCGA